MSRDQGSEIRDQGGINRYDLLKCFALLVMTVDHLGWYVLGNPEEMRLIGRLAMPVFCFLVGYNRSYRYREELFWVAFFVSFAAVSFGHYWHQNILWSILATRFLLARVPLSTWQRWTLPLAFSGLPLFVVIQAFFDYGPLVLFWALAGRFAAEAPQRWEGKAYLALSLALTLFQLWDLFAAHTGHGMLASLILIALSLLLWRLKPAPVALPAPLAAAAGWLSRNALYYYGVHVVALMTLGHLLETITPS